MKKYYTLRLSTLQVSEASANHLSLEHSDEGRRWANEQASQYAVQICDLLMRMPRSLLLLLKTNDCLRSVDYALGQVTPVPLVKSPSLQLLAGVIALATYTLSQSPKSPTARLATQVLLRALKAHGYAEHHVLGDSWELHCSAPQIRRSTQHGYHVRMTTTSERLPRYRPG